MFSSLHKYAGVVLAVAIRVSCVQSQVPGAVYTVSGYDNANGKDAICWSAPAFHNHSAVDAAATDEERNWNSAPEEYDLKRSENAVNATDDEHIHDEDLQVDTFDGINWNSSLVPDFDAGPTTMLPSCTFGTSVHVDIIPETVAGSNRLRTGHLYTYHVTGQVNLQKIREQYGLSDGAFFYSSDGKHDIGLRIQFCPVNGNLCAPFAPKKVGGLDGHLHFDGDMHDGDNHLDGGERADDEDHSGEHTDDEDDHNHGRYRKRGRRLRGRAIQVVDEDHDEHGDEDHDDEEHGDEDHDEHGDEDQGIDADEPQLFHLASPLFLIPVNDTNQTIFKFHQDVDVLVSVPGSYLPLATFEFFLSNETIHGHAVGIDSDAALKFDVANLLHQRAVVYYEQPDIMSVDSALEIVSYVIIGAAGVSQLFFLGATCYYRNHSVIKLSQGFFLILLQFAGIVATTCSFLYNPKSDAFCYLQSPMTLIPLQFMFAIVFGRLRRIICIMEPLMDWHAPQNKREMKIGFKAWKKTFMLGRSSANSSSRSSRSSSNGSAGDDTNEPPTREPEQEERGARWHTKMQQLCPRMSSRSNIRQTYTAGHLRLVIILVTLPIIVVEIVGLIWFRPELELHMNDEQSTGRYECGTNEEQIYHLASTGVLLVTMFAALYQAQRSRMLPGLFNEAACVSIALISSLFVATLGFSVIIVSNDPATSPDASYIMEVIIVAFIATSLVLRLTLPKLQLIWKGEKVVISRILEEHRKTLNQVRLQDEVTSLSHGVSELSATGRGTPDVSLQRPESVTSQQDSEIVVSPSLDSGSAGNHRREGSVTFDETTTKGTSEVSETPPQAKEPSLIIQMGQAPPDKLTFQVVRHSNVISRVNERILSGLQVDRSGWEDVKASVDELHGLLGNVEYQ
jgi:hypothetical protein